MMTIPMPIRRRCALIDPTRHVHQPPMARISHTGPARRFIILQRDDLLLVRWPFLADPCGVELLNGVAPALRRLQTAGFGLAIITHQPGIGEGWLDYEGLHAIHARLIELLLYEGVLMDGIYFCPHRPEDACDCRPPKPNLLLRAAEELKFIPSQCFVVGNCAEHLNLSNQVGALPIRIDAGGDEAPLAGGNAYRAASLAEAADWILLSKRLPQAA